MIIGKGLLAKSLSETRHDNHTLFCSGVSNSAEIDTEEFIRERDLLLVQPDSKPLFYFSTISIFNPSKAGSPYIQHKMEMETLVKSTFPSSLIVRLPNMVGLGGNGNNLFPFFLRSISQEQEVRINQNAQRYLLDIDDFPKIISCMMALQLTGEINVCYSEPAPVIEMYAYMCRLLGKEPHALQAHPEENAVVDNQRFLDLLGETGLPVQSNWKKTVERLTLLASHTGQLT